MDYKKLFIYPIALYAIIFMFWSIAMAYGFDQALWANIVSLVITLMAVCYMGRKVNAGSFCGTMKYTIVWVVVLLALDATITVQFTGWGVFNSWLYAGYAIVLLWPPIAAVCRKKCSACCVKKEIGAEE